MSRDRQSLPCFQGPGAQRDSGDEPPGPRGSRDAERTLSIGRPSSWRRASGRVAHHVVLFWACCSPRGVKELSGHAAGLCGQRREYKQLEGNICEGDARSRSSPERNEKRDRG